MKFAPHIMVCSIATACANPLIMEPDRDFIRMTEERVVVRVGESGSQVEGTYAFSREEDSGATFMRIQLPVLSDKHSPSATVEVITPTVKIGQKTFKTRESAPIDLTAKNAPAGCRLDWFEVEVPTRGIGKTFEARVSYFQPHISGSTAAYLPLEPPKNGSSKIIFQTSEDLVLKPRTKGWTKLKSVDGVEYRPENRKLLRVEVSKTSSKRGSGF